MTTRFHPGFLAIATLSLAVFGTVFPGSVEASCGLQSCPRPAQHHDAPVLQVEARSRWVAFESGSVSGSYAALAPRLLWRPFRHWMLGAEIPVTRLQAAGEVHTGLSNPLLTALYARRLSDVWSGEAGLQLELPLGDADHGLADDHTMILPWIGLRRDLGDVWNASALLGFSRALETEDADAADTLALAKVAHNGEDHGAESGAPVYVNPHGDREIQWRFAVARLFGPSTVEAFALGQMDVSDGVAHAVHYARAGLSWEYALTRVLGVTANGDVPLTTTRRSEMEIGLSLRAAW